MHSGTKSTKESRETKEEDGGRFCAKAHIIRFDSSGGDPQTEGVEIIIQLAYDRARLVENGQEEDPGALRNRTTRLLWPMLR